MKNNSEFVNLFLFILKNENLEYFLKNPPIHLPDYFNDHDFVLQLTSKFSKDEQSNHEIFSAYIIQNHINLFDDFEFTKKYLLKTPHFNTIQKILSIHPEYKNDMISDLDYVVLMTQSLNIKTGIFKIFPELSHSSEFFSKSPYISGLDISNFSNPIIFQQQNYFSPNELCKIIANKPINYKALNEQNREKTYPFLVQFLQDLQDKADYNIKFLLSEFHHFLPTNIDTFAYSCLLAQNRLMEYIPEKHCNKKLFSIFIDSFSDIDFSNQLIDNSYHHFSKLPGNFFKKPMNNNQLFQKLLKEFSKPQNQLFLSSTQNYAITHNLFKKIAQSDKFVKKKLADILIKNNLLDVKNNTPSKVIDEFFKEKIINFFNSYQIYYNSYEMDKKLPKKQAEPNRFKI